jgi:aldehyde dehydrogenase (NAD+)
MGRIVGERLARRFARAILELGGNNASIVTPSADLDLTLRAVAFGAMGTAGQRCTSMRRLIVHESVYDALAPKLAKVYRDISVGDPTASSALVGPLIDGDAFAAMQKALAAAKAAGGIVHGGDRVEVNGADAFYARPALVEMPAQVGPVIEETFAPILYVLNIAISTKRWRCTTACHRGCRRRSSPLTSARSSASCPRLAPIAASPTSIWARRAPRSAAPSAARRRPAGDAKAAPTRGRPTCAARPAR